MPQQHTPASRAYRLVLLDLLREAWGNKGAAMARAMGVSEGLFSELRNGRAQVTGEHLHLALSVTLASFPELGAFALESLNVLGRVATVEVSDPDPLEREPSEEMAGVSAAVVEMHTASRKGDEVGLARAHRQLRERGDRLYSALRRAADPRQGVLFAAAR